MPPSKNELSVDQRKTRRVMTNLTPAEYATVAARARNARQSMSTYLRVTLGFPPTPWTPKVAASTSGE